MQGREKIFVGTAKSLLLPQKRNSATPLLPRLRQSWNHYRGTSRVPEIHKCTSPPLSASTPSPHSSWSPEGCSFTATPVVLLLTCSLGKVSSVTLYIAWSSVLQSRLRTTVLRLTMTRNGASITLKTLLIQANTNIYL